MVTTTAPRSAAQQQAAQVSRISRVSHKGLVKVNLILAVMVGALIFLLGDNTPAGVREAAAWVFGIAAVVAAASGVPSAIRVINRTNYLGHE